MRLKNLVASAALVATAITAPAQAAAESIPARTSAAVEGEELAGGNVVIAILAVIAIGLGLYFALDDGDDSVSP